MHHDRKKKNSNGTSEENKYLITKCYSCLNYSVDEFYVSELLINNF